MVCRLRPAGALLFLPAKKSRQKKAALRLPAKRFALWRVPSRHEINPAKKKTRLTPQTVFLRLSGLISFCSAELKGRERQSEKQQKI